MTEYRKSKGQTALESVEQESLMRWVQFVAGKYPELELLYHIPNGGTRNKREAEHLRRQGVKAGVPDLCLPVPRGEYHGLYIELKAKDNTPTEKQKEWLAKLDKQGYKTAVCWGWETAAAVIEEYLRKAPVVDKWERLMAHLSYWQQDVFSVQNAKPVSGYDLIGAVMEIVEEIGGLKNEKSNKKY